MGIIFWRQISRLGMSASWPELVPGKGIERFPGRSRIPELSRPLVLEAMPSFTYSSGWNRLSPSSWSGADQTRDLGIGIKYGITSSIVAEATWNPDFSQVESDAMQVTVNQRYPILYSEKRPFFMEAGNLFDLGGIAEGMSNMSKPVHTRFVVDPQWGLRLTGEQGNGFVRPYGLRRPFPGQSLGRRRAQSRSGSQGDFLDRSRQAGPGQ